ncbi:MAG TPA: ABC transporter permease [Gemmataceae bacterium]|nr:ABC transporter permease [Gemmataceae bacterium]
MKAFLRSFQRTEWALLAAIVVVVVLTALLDEQHNYWRNPRASAVDILRQTSLLGIFALGAAVVIIAGGIDLSSGSVIAFSGTVCAAIMVLLAPEEMVRGRPVGTAVIAAAIAGTLLVGLLIGSLHAWLITVVGLPPFIATLATLVGLRSLGRALAETVTAPVYRQQKYQIEILDSQFRYLATSVWIPVVLFVVLAAALWVLLSRTVVGRHLHALGGNEQAARLSGIETDRLKWLAYCISAVTASVAGILYIADQAVAAPQTLGRGYELNAIAAAVVGGCSLQGGVGTIPGTVLGALFLRVVIDSVAKIIKVGADVYEGLIVGVVVVVAVALTQLREAGRRGKRFFEGTLGVVTVLNLTLLAGALALLVGQRLVISILASIFTLSRPPAEASALVAQYAPSAGTLALAAATVVLLTLVLAQVVAKRRRDGGKAAGE